MKKALLISLLFFSLSFNSLFAQDTKITDQDTKKPKIGLCLSGGGAKGLAHIGVLKLIDSLGIKVDYITGTSMGSVLGALYASGWSGNQIDSITRSIDWAVILNQYVPMDEISMDEKDEYLNYIGEIPLKNRKVNITGFIEGQKILNTFIDLTRHVNHISDFSKLPIPYKCMAVDIIKVEPLLMDHGNLAIAMRSSMAIPTVFKPVKFEDKLLVDGGIMVNFPVKELKEMGADIIIGSYTGGRLFEKEELTSINRLLLQSSSFYGINQSADNIEMCHIFNNLTMNMKEFQAGDFNKSDVITDKGIEISKQILPELIDLSIELDKQGLLREKIDLIQSNEKFNIREVKADSLNQKRLNKFVKKSTKVKSNQTSTYKDLEKDVKNIYGSRQFVKAYYSLIALDSANTYDLTYKIQEDGKVRVKGALHYDNELGAGIKMNITARNWIGKTSRLVATFDASSFFKFRIHYRKYIGQSRFSFNTELLREKSLVREYNNQSKPIDDLIKTYTNYNIGYNYNFIRNASIYSGLSIETNKLADKYSNPSISDLELDRLFSLNVALKTQLNYNTLNHPFYPTKGLRIIIEDKFVPISNDDAEYVYVEYDTLTGFVSKSTSKITTFNPYNKFHSKLEAYYPIAKNISLTGNLNFGLIFQDITLTEGDQITESGTPYLEKWALGGAIQRANTAQIPLLGLKEFELSVSNYSILQLGTQLLIKNKFFITPTFAYTYVATTNKDFVKRFTNFGSKSKTESGDNLDYYNNFYNYGVSLKYKSIIGPISLYLMKVPESSSITSYLSIGYHF